MSAAARPLALFVSYSHKDDDLRAKLDAHLSLLKRQDVFDVWHDRRIGAGREWAGEIAASRGPISISFTAGINRYRGMESVELCLEDWQPDPVAAV